MTVHLIKLSAGCQAVEQLEAWQAARRKAHGRLFHVTRMMPRRTGELLDGGSIYWVIKGEVRVRQPLLGIERVTGEDGVSRALLLLRPGLIRTRPQGRRAFQGWRYLEPGDAPADLAAGQEEFAGMPPEMRDELRHLGLL